MNTRNRARAILFLLLSAIILVPFLAVAASRTYGVEGEVPIESPAPSEEQSPIESPSEAPIEPTPTPTETPLPTEEPTPSLSPTPDEVLQDTWFARRTEEQLAEWAATQEAKDRAWLAAEIALRGTEPFIKTSVCTTRPIYYDEDGTLVGYVESCVERDSWTWSPCWPPEAMAWYPSDFPPPANWVGVRSGCR